MLGHGEQCNQRCRDAAPGGDEEGCRVADCQGCRGRRSSRPRRDARRHRAQYRQSDRTAGLPGGVEQASGKSLLAIGYPACCCDRDRCECGGAVEAEYQPGYTDREQVWRVDPIRKAGRTPNTSLQRPPSPNRTCPTRQPPRQGVTTLGSPFQRDSAALWRPELELRRVRLSYPAARRAATQYRTRCPRKRRGSSRWGWRRCRCGCNNTSTTPATVAQWLEAHEARGALVIRASLGDGGPRCIQSRALRPRTA